MGNRKRGRGAKKYIHCESLPLQALSRGRNPKPQITQINTEDKGYLSSIQLFTYANK